MFVNLPTNIHTTHTHTYIYTYMITHAACQFGLDICGVDILKPLNAITSIIAALLFPVNMELPRRKAKVD